MKAGLQASQVTKKLLTIHVLLFIVSYYNVYFITPFGFKPFYLDPEKSLHTISHTAASQH